MRSAHAAARRSIASAEAEGAWHAAEAAAAQAAALALSVQRLERGAAEAGQIAVELQAARARAEASCAQVRRASTECRAERTFYGSDASRKRFPFPDS